MDPTNTDWLDELSENHFRIGTILEAQGRVDEALQLVDGADPRQQAWSYRRISRLIASATAADLSSAARRA